MLFIINLILFSLTQAQSIESRYHLVEFKNKNGSTAIISVDLVDKNISFRSLDGYAISKLEVVEKNKAIQKCSKFKKDLMKGTSIGQEYLNGDVYNIQLTLFDQIEKDREDILRLVARSLNISLRKLKADYKISLNYSLSGVGQPISSYLLYDDSYTYRYLSLLSQQLVENGSSHEYANLAKSRSLSAIHNSTIESIDTLYNGENMFAIPITFLPQVCDFLDSNFVLLAHVLVLRDGYREEATRSVPIASNNIYINWMNDLRLNTDLQDDVAYRALLLGLKIGQASKTDDLIVNWPRLPSLARSIKQSTTINYMDLDTYSNNLKSSIVSIFTTTLENQAESIVEFDFKNEN